VRRPVLWYTVAAVLLVAACAAPTAERAAPSSPQAHQLSPAEFGVEADNGERLVINVHTPDEGSIPGTDASIPFDRLQARAAELPADRAAPLAVYCMTGRMSAAAVATLADLGYTDVVELAGGMVAWRADGRPLVAPGP
jgi:phage shock protein E